MQNILIIVFTQQSYETKEKYLGPLGLLGLGTRCRVQAINFSAQGCVCPGDIIEAADILLVADREIDASTRQILSHYIDKSRRLIIVYHISSVAKQQQEQILKELCSGKTVCSTQEHTTVGHTVDALAAVARATQDSSEGEYQAAIEQIVNSVCGDPILEAKLELLHRLLVPPATALSLQELDEWKRLGALIERDLKESVGPYEEAWTNFLQANPHQYHDNPFHETYCGREGLLAKFRDVLLDPS